MLINTNDTRSSFLHVKPKEKAATASDNIDFAEELREEELREQDSQGKAESKKASADRMQELINYIMDIPEYSKEEKEKITLHLMIGVFDATRRFYASEKGGNPSDWSAASKYTNSLLRQGDAEVEKRFISFMIEGIKHQSRLSGVSEEMRGHADSAVAILTDKLSRYGNDRPQAAKLPLSTSHTNMATEDFMNSLTQRFAKNSPTA